MRPSPNPRCVVCGSDDLEVVAAVPPVPVLANAFLEDADAARSVPRGELSLALCHRCTALMNVAFDARLVRYGGAYENSLHFSATFDRYAEDLAHRLVERHDVRGGLVVEVGSGKGEFLVKLCEAGGNRGLGFDPSHDGAVDTRGQAVTFVPELFPGGAVLAGADLVCSRHVLEHVEQPSELVAELASGLDPARRTVVYVEVPDAGYMLREGAVWDLVYEHRSYFAAPALRRLFRRAGFEPAGEGTAFGGQYLFLEVVRVGGPVAEPRGEAAERAEVARSAGTFGARLDRALERWGGFLDELLATGRRVALWGAGSKGVTFLNLVEGGDRVDAVVDVNPRKHGLHVPGTGQAVVAPETLGEDPVDVVLVMNPLYEDEIRARLDGVGVAADVVTVTGER